MRNLGTVALETNRLIIRKFNENDGIYMYNNWASDVGRILRTFKIKKNVEVTDNGKIII